MEMRLLASVSYTHLDVYKRQVFDDCFGIRKIRFGIDIEALLMFVVTFGLDFFKRRSNCRMHFIQECSAERIAKVRIIKMTDRTPEAIITKPTF